MYKAAYKDDTDYVTSVGATDATLLCHNRKNTKGMLWRTAVGVSQNLVA